MSNFEYKNNVLHAESVNIETLAQEVETPFYCYSSKAIQQGYRTYLDFFTGIPTEIRFAARSNPNIAILRQLYLLGAGIECVSGTELVRAIKAGIDGSKILFSGMVKTAAEITFALKHGVAMIIVETEPELEIINTIAASLNTKAKIGVRIDLDIDNRNNKRVTLSRTDTKYGIEWAKARTIYQQLPKFKNLEVKGIATHLGSQFINPIPFTLASKRLATLIEMLRSDGHTIDFIDLGGGMENAYAAEGLSKVKEFADIVVKVFASTGATLLASPGQVIMADAGILVTKSLLVRRQPQRNVMAIDATLCDFVHPDLNNIQHELVPVTLPKKNAKERVDIIARVFGNSEIIAKKRTLPLLAENTFYAFQSVGAYAAAMDKMASSNETDTTQVLVDGSNHAVINKQKSFADQVFAEQMPKWL